MYLQSCRRCKDESKKKDDVNQLKNRGQLSVLLANKDVNRLKNRCELIFFSVHPSVPGLMTNTALEAIASSCGKNVKTKRLEGET